MDSIGENAERCLFGKSSMKYIKGFSICNAQLQNKNKYCSFNHVFLFILSQKNENKLSNILNITSLTGLGNIRRPNANRSWQMISGLLGTLYMDQSSRKRQKSAKIGLCHWPTCWKHLIYTAVWPLNSNAIPHLQKGAYRQKWVLCVASPLICI